MKQMNLIGKSKKYFIKAISAFLFYLIIIQSISLTYSISNSFSNPKDNKSKKFLRVKDKKQKEESTQGKIVESKRISPQNRRYLRSRWTAKKYKLLPAEYSQTPSVQPAKESLLLRQPSDSVPASTPLTAAEKEKELKELERIIRAALDGFNASKGGSTPKQTNVCASPLPKPPETIDGSVTAQIQTQEPEKFYPLVGLGDNFNEMCETFIESDGSLGEDGLAVINAIEEVSPSCFYEKIKFPELCPQFENFSLNQKKHFWAWVFAAIAQGESSCNPLEKAQGTNDLAVGYLGLENSYTQRKDANRHEHFCSANKPTNMYDKNTQFVCGSAIFYQFHCEETVRPVPYYGSYWEGLKTTNGKISKNIKLYPGCN